MRWVLVIAFCIAVGATTWAGARDEQSGLHVTIGYALPESDVEDSDNELGRKYWDVFPPVTVESERRCDRAELTTRADNFFNGERGFGSPEEPVESELNGDGYRFEDRAEGPTALAGETIRITATARCVSGGSFTTVSARREFELPTASCDRGPLRVGELEGRVKAVDWDHEEQGERVLQPGFLITPGSELTVEPGGRAEIGAPECNGLRVILYEGEHTVGSYSREGRGDSFSTERIVGEGDSHAGGVLVPDRATVWPLGFRCRGCQATGPSWYEIRSTAERVTVRVFRGEVLVGGPEDPPTLRVSAGHQASVLCEAGTCRAGHLRLFQAKEPWSTPPEGLVDRLPRSVAGADPLLSAFAPPFSDIQAERLPAAAREPDQVVIAWSREVRRDDGSHEWELGFLGWQRVAPKRWQLVYEQPVECCPAMGIETGTLLALRAVARRVQQLTVEERELAREIEKLTTKLAPQLLNQHGIGPLLAAQIVLSWSHRGRVVSEAAFARLAGAAPIPASSGQTIRYRPDRSGDRQLNRALHQIVVTRRRTHRPTIDYIERRTQEGKSRREATRCLKRYLARNLYRLLETPSLTT